MLAGNKIVKSLAKSLLSLEKVFSFFSNFQCFKVLLIDVVNIRYKNKCFLLLHS